MDIGKVFGVRTPTAEQYQAIEKIRAAAYLFAADIQQQAPLGHDHEAALRKVREAYLLATQAILLNGQS